MALFYWTPKLILLSYFVFKNVKLRMLCYFLQYLVGDFVPGLYFFKLKRTKGTLYLLGFWFISNEKKLQKFKLTIMKCVCGD